MIRPLLACSYRRLAPYALLTCALVCWSHAARGQGFGDFKGMWVSRFEYNEDSVADIQQKLSDAASLGITDVMWQVRGRADAYYYSNFESPAQGWQQNIDPLQVAIDAAHSNGIKLHAWMNTMPLWSNSTSPADTNHIWYNSDPSFRVTDINGQTEAIQNGASTFGGSYARVNHVLPEVQTHINNVVNDIATSYDVDGIHLDYIRWLGPSGGAGESFRPDWDYLPHDPYSHQLYQQETGLNGADGSSYAKREAYRDWVQGKITQLVTSVGQTVDSAELAEGRQIQLSAAVWNNPTTAERDYMQDYRTWLQQDLLDIAMPMVYLDNGNSHLLDGFLTDILDAQTNTDISIGLGTYLHDAGGGGVNETISQLQKVYGSGADSASFYSYGSFFDAGSLGADRADAVADWYAALADVPPAGGVLSPDATVITSFDSPGDQGYFNSPITAAGQTTIGSLSVAEQTSDESHMGGGSQLLDIDANGSWTLRHLAGGSSPAGNLVLTAEGSVGFWLKTDDPGLTVQIAVDDPSTADRGTLKNVIADNQWRLYEWDLSDDDQWQAWVNGDGAITGPTLTLDSIFFYGSGDATIYLDTVAHNPLGSLLAAPVVGDYDGSGTVDAGDFDAWLSQFGATVTPGDGADGNGDGKVDARDYAVWREAYAASVPAPAPLNPFTPVPAPGGLALLAGLALGVMRRGRGRWLAG